MERAKELKDAVKAFNAYHHNWAAEPDGRNYPPNSYFELLEGVFDLFASGPVPHESSELHSIVQEVREALIRHDNDPMVEFDKRTGEPVMPDYFWQAREKMEEYLAQPEYITARPAQSIQLLHEQMGAEFHWQIAKMYGLVDERGNPRVDLVAKELAQPGSVITEDWEHPADKARREKLQVSRNQFEELTSRVDTTERGPKPCPETCEQLWFDMGQDMNFVEQAAKMLQRPVDEVKAEWEQYKAGNYSDPVEKAEEAQEQQLTKAELIEQANALGITVMKSDTKKSIESKIKSATEALA